MATLITDPILESRLLAERRRRRGDRFDEVWDGVYIMSPLPNIEHQRLVKRLCDAITLALADSPGTEVFPGVNVADRRENWKENYRCPDVAVVLTGSRAVECGAFYLGGPDFVIEVASDYDRSREKFEFYASIGVREFLIVDRDPWQLELYALQANAFSLVGRSAAEGRDVGIVLASRVLPLTLELVAPSQPGRPQIAVVQTTSGARWLV